MEPPKILSEAEQEVVLKKRWHKKGGNIESLSENIQSLRYNVTTDLKSDNEKVFLTACVLSLMLRTAERVGNEESAKNNHVGITGLRKRNIDVVGNKINLYYKGKSAVDHETSFTDPNLAKCLKRAIKKSPKGFIFTTSDGFKIKKDRINRYLSEYDVSAKDLRGFRANEWVLDKLRNIEPEETEAKRKKQFLAVLKSVSEKIGHTRATLRKHYLFPQVENEFILHGKVSDMETLAKFHTGGKLNETEMKKTETGDGKKGGVFEGKRHSEGGIKAVVVDIGKPIEVETGEIIITRKASAEHCEELSKINQSGGGVAIPCNKVADDGGNNIMEEGGAIEESITDAAAKFGWTVRMGDNMGDDWKTKPYAMLFNRNEKKAAYIIIKKDKYDIFDMADTKLLSGKGQIGVAVEKVIGQYFYGKRILASGGVTECGGYFDNIYLKAIYGF